jgi:hypothetical protein
VNFKVSIEPRPIGMRDYGFDAGELMGMHAVPQALRQAEIVAEQETRASYPDLGVLFVLAEMVGPTRDQLKLTIEEPRWQHHCDRCVFLGRHRDGDEMFDLYMCAQHVAATGTEFLARFGNVPGNYLIGGWFRGSSPHAEAERRAYLKGLAPGRAA